MQAQEIHRKGSKPNAKEILFTSREPCFLPTANDSFRESSTQENISKAGKSKGSKAKAIMLRVVPPFFHYRGIHAADKNPFDPALTKPTGNAFTPEFSLTNDIARWQGSNSRKPFPWWKSFAHRSPANTIKFRWPHNHARTALHSCLAAGLPGFLSPAFHVDR